QLLLEVLALALRTLGLLAAIDECFKIVVTFLADIAIHRHNEHNPHYVRRFLYISAACFKTSCSCSVRLSLPFSLIFSSTASNFASRCSSTLAGGGADAVTATGSLSSRLGSNNFRRDRARTGRRHHINPRSDSVMLHCNL